jgi:hypothetical protein
MARVNNWPKVLGEQIELARDTPFAWGTHDCCLWAANVAVALTGKDPAKDWRGKYTTALEAARFIEESSGGLLELVSAGCDSVGFVSQIPAYAQRGDIVLARQGMQELAGICIGAEWVGPSKEGLLKKPMGDAILAWRVA